MLNNVKKGAMVVKNEIVKTGIDGLDIILKGGLRRGTSLLVTGAPGTGKTIMALQFIYNGAKKHNESGIFISTEESLDDLRMNANNLGMDIQKYEKSGKIMLFEKQITRLKGGLVSYKGLISLIKSKKIKRVVLDSLVFFEYLYPVDTSQKMEYRRHVLQFIHQMKEAGVTFMTTSERAVTDLDRFLYDTMDFLVDGFVILTRIRKGSYFERCITVGKVRGRDHSLGVYPISIGKGGVSILTNQIPFSLVERDMGKFKQEQ